MVDIHPQKIAGPWKSGVALDFHTIKSTPAGYNSAGHMQYETERTEIAELLYRLKYRADRKAATGIIEAAAAFLRPHRRKLDMIVPVPPSSPRRLQPVPLLARGIGEAIALPFEDCVVLTRSATQLKDVTDPERRRELVDGLHSVDAGRTRGKNILLFDDIFRSGATMKAVTQTLLRQGEAASVRALTITRTRSNQ